MRLNFSRRLAQLEARQGRVAKRVHIITATDQDDANRQMAALIVAGAARDGFLCITGKPLAH